MKINNKTTWVVLSFVASITILSAQSSYPILEWSPEYSARSAKFDRLLQVGETGFYTYRPATSSLLSGSRDEYFAYYNRSTLTEEWLLKNPKWEWEGKRVDYKSSVIIENVQYLFYESYDRQRDVRNLLVRTLDTLALLSEPRLVETMDSRRRSQGEFAIKLSEDKSKIAIFTNPPFKIRGSENFYVRIYNENLEEQWNADIELTYRDRNFRIMDFDVTNSGDVFILSVYDSNPNISLSSGRNLDYKLMRIQSGDHNKITEFDLGLTDVSVHSLGIQCDLKDNQMSISGFYGKRNYYDMDGSLYLAVDQEKGEVTSSSLSSFSEEFVAQFNRNRLFKGRGIRKNFVFRQFMPRPDGGAYVIAEDYDVRVVTTQNSRGATTTNYYYYYNDIIVLSIDKDGEVDWYAHIPKRQTSMNDGGYYLGYTFLMNEEGLHFVYNDHRKNAKRWGKKPLRTITNAKNGNLVMVSVSHDAKMTYTLLNRNKKQKFRVSPRSSRLGDDGRDGAVLLSLRGTRIRFGNLYFDK